MILKTITLNVIIVLLTSSLIAQGNKKSSNSEIISELNSKQDIMYKEVAKGNISPALEMWSPEAILYLPNGSEASGIETQKAMLGQMANSGLTFENKVLETEVMKHSALQIGILTSFDKSGAKIQITKYFVFWKLIDGEWKIYRDIIQNLPIEKG